MIIKTRVLLWQRVSFPLWQKSVLSVPSYENVNTPPSDEVIVKAEGIFERILHNVSAVRREHERDSSKDDGWIQWLFEAGFDEGRRMQIHLALVEALGKEVGGLFRWSGTQTRIVVENVIALGEHVQ